jgi:hypothetical protein
MSELELEHTLIEAGEDNGGEIAIEQAFLDYRIMDQFGLRAGIVLVPVGLINLYHEPPTFHGVERPAVDQVIIPTTWREAGAGVYGTPSEELSYQVYLVGGLDASGFSAGNGLRGGRQQGFRTNPANPSVTGRLGYAPAGGLLLGGSFFLGNAAGDSDSIGSASVRLVSADARMNIDPFTFRAVGAMGWIGDAGLINARFNGSVADRIYGFYAEAACNLLWYLAPESEQSLELFARYEKYNTQASTSGFDPLRQYDRNTIILGLTYEPVFNATVKLDYTLLNNALNEGAFPNTKQLNIGIGYAFF